MKISVIIFGATGMVGEGVLLKALDHENVESVLVIGRRPCMKAHPKLKEIILITISSITQVLRNNFKTMMHAFSAWEYLLWV